MNDNLTWVNGLSVKNIDTAIYWRLKRIKQLDLDKIINTRQISTKLINAIELTNIIN